MPSSLTEVLPSTSVCSTSPPVSVCGTGGDVLARGFSRQSGLDPCGLGLSPRLPVTPRSSATGLSRGDLPTGFDALLTGAGPAALRPRLARNGGRRYGTLHPFAIAYGSRPRLRTDSPAADQPCCGTLGHPVWGILTPIALLIPAFALPPAPRVRHRPASPPGGTLPYHAAQGGIRGFGGPLEPR